ncbi:MAG TPA: histidine phosphatase family protein [Bacteroidales bacterium]
MKTLYLVRHAKSSWNMPHLDDLDRPLLEKGLKRTRLMIDFLKKRRSTIDLILCSPAVRAYETAKLFAWALEIPEEALRQENGIYAADADRLGNQFFDLPANVNSLMMVGHNPGITDFANLFLHPRIEMLPTSGMVGLEFETDKWEEIMDCKSKKLFVVFPKMFD